MKKTIYAFALFLTLNLMSCMSSNSTLMSYGVSPSAYKYMVFDKDGVGDAEAADILMLVQQELSYKFVVISPKLIPTLLAQGDKILSPKISVKTEKWDGGHTYISISFYDYETNQSLGVVKSSGSGLSVSQDQQLAFYALRRELNKVFK